MTHTSDSDFTNDISKPAIEQNVAVLLAAIEPIKDGREFMLVLVKREAT